MNHDETIYGWHFVGDTLRDGTPIPKNGVWLPKITPIALCQSGYHGSQQPSDALQYAPGNTLCYCEYKGAIVLDGDKFVAEQRRIVARMDATKMLYYFARMQAVSVAHLWEPPDVVLDYLMTGDESFRVAAYAAARVAARAAARAAAYIATRDAAYAAAYAAARDAAYAAAYAADYTAAYAAARDAARAAAYAADYAAARAAAYAAARTDFNSLVYECFGLEIDTNEPR